MTERNSNPFAALADDLATRGRNAVANAVRGAVDADEDGDDDDGEDDDGEDGEDDDGPGMAFEDSDDEDHAENVLANRASAAGAYRALGGSGDIVASHKPTGRAFFGTEADLEQYIADRDLDDDGWVVFDDPAKIMDLDYDDGVMLDLLQWERSQDAERIAEVYKAHQWGNDVGTFAVRNIEGLEGVALAVLGPARRIEYGSRKGGAWNEYFHEHGEDSGTFPDILFPEHGKWYVVHGGRMRVKPEGLTD